MFTLRTEPGDYTELKTAGGAPLTVTSVCDRRVCDRRVCQNIHVVSRQLSVVSVDRRLYIVLVQQVYDIFRVGWKPPQNRPLTELQSTVKAGDCLQRNRTCECGRTGTNWVLYWYRKATGKNWQKYLVIDGVKRRISSTNAWPTSSGNGEPTTFSSGVFKIST